MFQLFLLFMHVWTSQKKYCRNCQLKINGQILCVKLFVSACHYIREKMYIWLNVNGWKLMLNIIFTSGQMNILNANINVDTYSFISRKIKQVDMKCILEREKCRFSFKRNKTKGIWVNNNSLLSVCWVSTEKSILTEEIWCCKYSVCFSAEG